MYTDFHRARIRKVSSTNATWKIQFQFLRSFIRYSTSSYASLQQNKVPLTRHVFQIRLLQPAVLLQRFISRKLFHSNPLHFPEENSLRLCNSATRQVERSQEATNVKRALDSSHFSNSLEWSRLRVRFFSNVHCFLSYKTQLDFFVRTLISLRDGEFQRPMGP